MTLERTHANTFLPLIAIVFAALVFTGLQPPTAAHAVTNIQVTVNLTTKTGTALTGVTVTAQQVEDHHAVADAITATPVTGKPGRYLFTALVASEPYALHFDAPASVSTTFDQYWGASPTIEGATYLQWGSDSVFNAGLATNVTILGKVTGSSKKAVAGVKVTPVELEGTVVTELSELTVVTNSTGGYTLSNLAPGSYRVKFTPPNKTGYVPSAPSTIYNVTLGTSKTANATLTTGATISGTVAGPVTGVVAKAYPYDGTVVDTSKGYVSATTASDGKWTIPGLPAGVYVVKLTVASGFIEAYTPGVTDFATADTFTVSGTQKISAGLTTLQPRTTTNGVSIHVFRTDASPVDPAKTRVIIRSFSNDASIELSAAAGTPLSSTGDISLPFLPTGGYNVWVDPGTGDLQPFMGVKQVTPAASDDLWSLELHPASAFQITGYELNPSSGYVVGSSMSVQNITTSAPPGSDVRTSLLWLRDGQPIYGERGDNYEFTGADRGAQISVLIRADTFGFPATFTEVDLDAVGYGSAPVVSVQVTPAGQPWGNTLTARVSVSSAILPTAYSYEWWRDSVGSGSPLSLTATYTTQAADAGHPLIVKVTSTAAGRNPGTATSFPVTPGLVFAVNTKAPSATSKKVGGDIVFTATSGTWSPSYTGVPFSYSWYINGDEQEHGTTLICDADGIPEADEIDCGASGTAAAIELTAFSVRSGFAAAQRRVVIRTAAVGVTPSLTAPATITDDEASDNDVQLADAVDIGHVLRAVHPVLDFPGSGSFESYTYQWQISPNGVDGWTNVSKGTASSYTAMASQVGKHLRVRVTASSSVYKGSYPYYAVTGPVQLRQNLVEAVTTPSVQFTTLQNVAGNTLRASISGPWSGGLLPTQKLQWYVCAAAADCTIADRSHLLSSNWVAATGATGTSFTTPSTPGISVLVQVTATLTNHQAAYLRTSRSNLQASGAAAYLEPPALQGGGNEATVGKPAAFSAGVLDDPNATVVHKWYRFDNVTHSPVLITDATGPSYTPTGEVFTTSEGLQYSQTVTSHGVTSDPLFTKQLDLVAGTNTAITAPTTSKTGTTFIVNAGTWQAPDTQIAYQWYRAGTPQVTSPTFDPLVTSDPVYVDLTITAPGYTTKTVRLVAQKAPASALTPASAPITGTPGITVGSTLDIDEGSLWPMTFGTADSTYKYQWYSGTKAIKNATGATYAPVAADKGKAIKVKVTLVSPYYASPAPFTSATVTITVGGQVTGDAAITGTPLLPGTTLSVTKSGFPSGTTFTYSWQRAAPFSTDWVSVGTKSTYKIAPTDAGFQLRVVLTAKRSGYTTGTVIGDPIEPEYLGDVLTAAPPKLSSSSGAPIGSVVTASSTWKTSPVTLTYEWYRNGDLVPGATGATYTLPPDSLGDQVYARITAKRPGYLDGFATTNAVIVGEGAVPVAAAIPVISGMTGPSKAPAIGDTLTASRPAWNVDGLEFVYTWWADGDELIQTGGDNTLLVVAGLGKTITVEIEATRPGWATGSKKSAPTVPVVATP